MGAAVLYGDWNMLVLSRKESQSIRIGEDIVITLVRMSGDKARIGIQAPANVSIHRQEIYDRLQARASEPEEQKE